MFLNSIKAGGKAFLAVCYRNRATIATGAGMLAVVVGTGVVISKATQAAEVAEEIAVKNNYIHNRDEADDWSSPSERSKARIGVLGFAAKEYTKTYALGLGIEAIGLGLIAWSDHTQNNQITTISTMLASTSATLSAVKERVIADQGEEKWQEYLLGPQLTTVDVMPDGTIVQTTEPIEDPSASNGFPPHCFFFDEANPNWEKDATQNRHFLEDHLRWLNRRLQEEGFLWENDIRRDIGAELVKSGWTSGIFAKDKNGMQNYISFGLEAKNPAAQAFRDGIEPSILIQLNVEDNITEQIKLPLV